MTERPGVAHSLHTAREVFSPTSEQRERVRVALRARLALGTASGATDAAPRATDAGARPAAQSRRALALAKSGVLLGIGFALGYWFAESRSEDIRAAGAQTLEEAAPAEGGRALALAESATALVPGAANAGVPAPERAAPAEAAEVVLSSASDPAAKSVRSANALSSAADASRRSRAHRARPRSHAPPASTPEELGLMQRAERAIRAGDGALARSFVAELEERFPTTTWREERSAILVLAACTLDEPGAQSGAQQFLQQQAASVYFDRIQTLCRLEATSLSNTQLQRETDGPWLDTDRAEENP